VIIQDIDGPAEWNSKKELNVFDIGFYFIAFLAAVFSGFATYKGFSYDLPKLAAFVFAMIVGLGLLLINVRIKEARVSRNGLGGAIGAFFMVFIFSFISNTNAIYTYFLKNDIVGQTQEKAWVDFDKGTSKIKTAVQSDPRNTERMERESMFNSYLDNLVRQIKDPANPGFGDKAQEHFNDLENLLGHKVTRLAAPPHYAPLSKQSVYAEQVKSLFRSQWDAQSDSVLTQDLESFLSAVDDKRSLYLKQVRLKQYSSTITDDMKRELKQLAIEGEKLTGFPIDVDEIDTSSDDIGSFQYTWLNFYNRVNFAAIVLSVLLSILLDILSPALSLMLYRPSEEY